MKISTAAGLAGALVLMAAVATPAAAQTAPSAPKAPAAKAMSGGDQKTDIEFGIDPFTTYINKGAATTYRGKGWHVGGSYRAAHIISVIAEITGTQRTASGVTTKLYSYSGGARFQSGSSTQTVRPFVQILLGTAQDNRRNGGGINRYSVLSPGFGADIRLAEHAAVRLRVDTPMLLIFGDTQKGFRLSAGVSIPMGHR